MADISKCANQWCPCKEECHRYTVESSEVQAYAAFRYDFIKKSCTYFWDNSEYKKAEKK